MPLAKRIPSLLALCSSLILLLPPSIGRGVSVDYSAHTKGVIANVFPGGGGEDFTAVAHYAGRAYLGGEDRFWVVSTGDPSNAHVLGATGLADEAQEIAVSGMHAYVAVGAPGLEIIRVAVPTNPTRAALLALSGNCRDVVVQGSYAYAVDGSGLRIIDVSDPANPGIVSTYGVGSAVAVEVLGGTAFLATTTLLISIDVSNPGNISRISQISLNSVRDLAGQEGLLFALREPGGTQLAVYDVSDPAQMTRIGTRALHYEYGRALDVELPYVYACTAGIWTNMSLEIIDVSDPTDPIVTGRTAGGFWDVADVSVESGIAYVADDIWGLNVVDASEPWSVSVVRTYPTGLSAWDVAFHRGYLLVADSYDGLTVIDPGSGAIVVQLPQVGEVYRIRVQADRAFLLGDDGLSIVDVADPQAPVLLSLTSLPGTVNFDIAVSGDFAYVANGADPNLVIVDVSDPAQPFVAGTYPGPFTEARGVAVAWPYVYLGSSWHAFQVVDVTDPAAPVGRGTAEPELQHWGYSGRLAVRDHYVYKTSGYGGMYVADVQDPDEPQITSVHTNFVTYGCEIEGTILYTERLDLGMQLWDLDSDPADPVLLGEVDTENQVRGIAFGDEAIYLATETNGTVAVPRHDALADVVEDVVGPDPRRVMIHPNPARGPLRVEMERGDGSPVSVEVLDLSGRRVRSLASEGSEPASPSVLLWDGRDEQGRSVPAGRYFLRLRGTGIHATRPITIVR